MTPPPSLFAASSARRSLTRLLHRWTDFGDLLAFSLWPFSTTTTELVVGNSARLRILQWPGSRVGSGGFVWSGARRLADHFVRHGDGCGRLDSGVNSAAMPGRPWRGMAVLELGAGTGAAGLAAAALGADVTLTDQAAFRFPGRQADGEGAGDATCAAEAPLEREKPAEAETLLDLMRINVAQNLSLLPAQAPVVAEMLWGDAAHMARLPRDRFDLICGTDVLLFEDAQKDLIRSLRRLSGEATVVIIEHTDRNSTRGEDYPRDLCNFLILLAEDGLWNPTVVRDHGRHITLRMVQKREGEAPFGGVMVRKQDFD